MQVIDMQDSAKGAIYGHRIAVIMTDIEARYMQCLMAQIHLAGHDIDGVEDSAPVWLLYDGLYRVFGSPYDETAALGGAQVRVQDTPYRKTTSKEILEQYRERR